MLRDYVTINRLLRTLMQKCIDAHSLEVRDALQDHDLIADYVLDDFRELKRLWPKDLDRKLLDDAYKEVDHVAWKGAGSTFLTALMALDDIMEQLEQYYSQEAASETSSNILGLLHPIIITHSYHHFNNGYYRDAVLNAFLAVFDLLRKRTGLDLDGSRLAQTAFSMTAPYLIISTLHTDTGKNEQIGFMNLLSGAYSSIRNPKAHSLLESPTKLVAAQNLVFASLLARQIDEAKLPSQDNP